MKKFMIVLLFLPLISGCAQMQEDSNSGPVCGQVYQDGKFYQGCAPSQFKYKWAQGWCSNHRNGANPDLVACLISQGLTVTPADSNRDITYQRKITGEPDACCALPNEHIAEIGGVFIPLCAAEDGCKQRWG